MELHKALTNYERATRMVNGNNSIEKLIKNDRVDKSEKKTSNQPTIRKVKRKINLSVYPPRTTQGPSPLDKNWKRKRIFEQIKNHTMSSAYNASNESRKPLQTIDTSHKLKEWQHVFQYFANNRKFGSSTSISSDSIHILMNSIGFSKYGFKIIDKSPYGTNDNNSPKSRKKTVDKIVARHSCFTSGDSRVPRYMGWYWTRIFYDKMQNGWRPGAIPKNIRNIMCYFNGPCSCMPCDLKTCPTYHKHLTESTNITSDDMEKYALRKPTLKVVRKDGLYLVSMNPLKRLEDLNTTQNPYFENCQPIQFQISLNRQSPESQITSGYLGYPCSERHPLCEDNKEMQNLFKILADECQSDSEFYDLAKTLCAKESDLDIEFIAPGATLNEKRMHREKKYKESQYDRKDVHEIVTTQSVPKQKKNVA